MIPRQFIESFRSIAKDIERQHRIPAIFILAQAACESAWGASAPGNMYFGVKADSSWKGKVQDVPTFEYDESGKRYDIVAKFRAYNCPADSFQDHALFLKQNGRYARAFQPYIKDQFIDWINKNGFADQATQLTDNRLLCDAYRFAYIMQVEKYATAPNYFVTLASIIHSLCALEPKLVPTP